MDFGGARLLITAIGVLVTAAAAAWVLLQSELASLEKELRASDARQQEEINRLLAGGIGRLEFMAEIKRLDQKTDDLMSRREFEVWRSERDKNLSALQTRQDRFTEALDAMYSRIMQQQPSYPPR